MSYDFANVNTNNNPVYVGRTGEIIARKQVFLGMERVECFTLRFPEAVVGNHPTIINVPVGDTTPGWY